MGASGRAVFGVVTFLGCGGGAGGKTDAGVADPHCDASPNPLCEQLQPSGPSEAWLPICDTFTPRCPPLTESGPACDQLYQFTAESRGLHLFTTEYTLNDTCEFGNDVPVLEILEGGSCNPDSEPIACDKFNFNECDSRNQIAICLDAEQEVLLAASAPCEGSRTIRVTHERPPCPGSLRRPGNEPIRTLGPGVPASEVVETGGASPQLFQVSCTTTTRPDRTRPQASLEFVAPAAGEYSFAVTNDYGHYATAAAVFDRDCCGPELACALSPAVPPGSEPVPAEVTVTLTEGQTVVVVGHEDTGSPDEGAILTIAVDQ
jgi:hypothetical protein